MSWFWATRLGRLVAIVAGALAAVFLARAKWRKDGGNDAEQRMRDDAYDRVEKGNEAVRRSDGNSPDERLRQNDGKW